VWRGSGSPGKLLEAFGDFNGEPSFSVNLSTGLYRCFGCGVKGDIFEFFMRRHGVDFPTALRELARFAGLDVEADTKNCGLTLDAFAKAKKLDHAFLTKHGVSQVTGKGGPYLVFTYRDHEGREIKEAVRFRFSMAERPKSKKGGNPMLYGLWRLPEFRPGGELILVEGESDSLTAWSYDLPAVGILGKTLLKTIDPAFFEGVQITYVWQEPDAPDFPKGRGCEGTTGRPVPSFREEIQQSPPWGGARGLLPWTPPSTAPPGLGHHPPSDGPPRYPLFPREAAGL
jgi:hypothetical protein